MNTNLLAQPVAHPDECPILIQRIASLYGVIAKETSGYVTAHIGSVPRSLVELVPARELVVEHGGGRFTWTRLIWLYGDHEPRRMMTLSTDEPPEGWVAPECCFECGAALTHNVGFYADEKNLCRKCTDEAAS
jgi:hypothetical protein